MVFGKVHTKVIVADLNEDYTDLTGEYTEHLHFAGPPLARESTCSLLNAKNIYYMVTSGTTGYYPNSSMIAKADNMHGPWYIMGDPCINDIEKNSFNAQISSVFKVPHKDLHIAIGDRWVIDLLKPLEKSSWKIDTSISEYVWLPFDFEDDMPTLKWQEKWELNLS